ncbi:hypothetical protein PC120_g21110 [Phytophthora cactorum]|nr:hypothetical protein PC120_g21110 [Phytophthora cactorum]
MGTQGCRDVDLSNPVKAVVTSPINGNAYEVKTFQYKCTFNFMQTWLLSCRHVIPVNNIADGDVEAGGLRLLSGPALPKEPAVSSAAEYQETKVLAEKIMTVMTLQSTPTYSVAHQWLEGFYEALHKGNVVEFTTQQDMSFAGISQISSVGSTRLSQTSCAGGILSSGASAFEHEATKNSLEVDDVTESVDETKAEALISQMPNGNVQNENGNDEDVTLGHQAQPEREEVTPNVTEPTPHVTKKDEKELKDRWIFAERPQINGMTKEQRNRAKPQDDRKAARIIAGKYRESKISSFAKFDNVSALLLELRSIPAIKQLLPLDTAMEGIDAIKMAEDIDLLAFWPGYGYATFYQLVGMKRIQEARHRLALVNRTVKWVDEVEWRIQDLRKHFEDTRAVTNLNTRVTSRQSTLERAACRATC